MELLGPHRLSGQEAMLFMLMERVDRLEADKTSRKAQHKTTADLADRLSKIEMELVRHKIVAAPMSDGVAVVVVGFILCLSLLGLCSMTVYLADTTYSWLRP